MGVGAMARKRSADDMPVGEVAIKGDHVNSFKKRLAKLVHG